MDKIDLKAIMATILAATQPTLEFHRAVRMASNIFGEVVKQEQEEQDRLTYNYMKELKESTPE
jgi:hypothetical protein